MSLMTDAITLNVQRWVYERGNYQIIVENAWNIGQYYCQERISVNGELIRDRALKASTILFWRTIFEDTILDTEGEVSLKVQWKSGIRTIHSRMLIDGNKQDWSEYFEKKWAGIKGEWPVQTDYQE